jgi:ATP-binding cassette subfamily B protein
VAALGRVPELRRLPVESSGTGRRLDLATVDGEIVLDGVTFAYPGRSSVLRSLLESDAEADDGHREGDRDGEDHNRQAGTAHPDAESGRVLLDGVDVQDLRLQDLRSGQSPKSEPTRSSWSAMVCTRRYGACRSTRAMT